MRTSDGTEINTTFGWWNFGVMVLEMDPGGKSGGGVEQAKQTGLCGIVMLIRFAKQREGLALTT